MWIWAKRLRAVCQCFTKTSRRLNGGIGITLAARSLTMRRVSNNVRSFVKEHAEAFFGRLCGCASYRGNLSQVDLVVQFHNLPVGHTVCRSLDVYVGILTESYYCMHTHFRYNKHLFWSGCIFGFEAIWRLLDYCWQWACCTYSNHCNAGSLGHDLEAYRCCCLIEVLAMWSSMTCPLFRMVSILALASKYNRNWPRSKTASWRWHVCRRLM